MGRRQQHQLAKVPWSAIRSQECIPTCENVPFLGGTNGFGPTVTSLWASCSAHLIPRFSPWVEATVVGGFFAFPRRTMTPRPGPGLLISRAARPACGVQQDYKVTKGGSVCLSLGMVDIQTRVRPFRPVM